MDIKKFFVVNEEANTLFKTLQPKEMFHLLEDSKIEEVISLKKLLNPEVIHHQFLKLYHFLEELLEKTTEELIEKNERLLPRTLTQLKQEETELLKMSSLFKKIQTVLEVSLSLSFRGGYLELIEKFETLKTYATRTERTLLHPLITKINEAKGDVFGKTEKDDDPAIDGLTAFGCSSLKHFRELKLLSEKHKIEEEFLSEEEKDEAFRTVQKNLSAFGLKTVRDLKNHEIYSKEALVAYLTHLLNTL
jgi:hypothetical protein